MREARLEQQLSALVAEHADWLTADGWAEACATVEAGYFESVDQTAELVETIKAHLNEP